MSDLIESGEGRRSRSPARWDRVALSVFEPLETRALLSITSVGGEIHVNTYLPGNQGSTRVAIDGDGDFVAVWVSAGQDGSGYGIYAQRFSAAGEALGNEFRVNTTTAGNQMYPWVAADPAGDFVVVWEGVDSSGKGVFGQRYNPQGQPLGTEFQVNTYTNDTQSWPSVAMDSSGDFVVAWQSYGQDGHSYGVYARRYDSAGEPLAPESPVNLSGLDAQYHPSAAMNDSGQFAIVWADGASGSTARDGSGFGIFGQVFDASGVRVGSEFQANTYTPFDQDYPAAAMDPAGNVVVAWQSAGHDGSGLGVYARRISASGVVQGGEIPLNQYTAGAQDAPAVAVDSAGDFVVTWESVNQDGSGYGIYARGYSSDGAPLADEFRVNATTTGSQGYPAIAMDPDGDTIIAWQSKHEQFGNSSPYGVYAQRYKASFDTTPPAVLSTAFNYLTGQSLQFRFTEDVSASLSTSDLAVQNLTDNTTIPSEQTALDYDTSTNTATFTFPGVSGGILADGNYRATLWSGGVADPAGNPLAADAITDFFVLAGDTDHNRTVDVIDLGILATHWQNTGVNFSQGDFNYDGTVDVIDLGMLASNWQKSIPEPASRSSVPATARAASGVRKPASQAGAAIVDLVDATGRTRRTSA